MTVLDLIRTKRATRQFSQQPVAEDNLLAILDAGRRAQSAKNSQPWYFIVIRERETLQRLSECGKYATHLPSAAFAIALVSTNTDLFDLGQAAAYLQLAAWEFCIGSCLVTMHEEEKAKAVLNIPPELYFHLLIDFGYPAPQEHPRPAKKGGRKSFEEVVRWEHWS